MAATATKLMTAEELERLPDDGYQYELVRGVLHRMSPASFRSSNIAMRVAIRIGTYAEKHNLGEITGADGGYILERGPDSVRAPDVAFVRAERLPTPEQQEHFAPIVPDLVVEVVSPSDRPKKLNQKIDDYLVASVPLVWVFYPRPPTVTVRRPGQPPRVLRADDVLDGEEILPGFRLPLPDVFR